MPESRPDRLPRPSSLSAEQQAAADVIAAGPRGALFGPFVPLLRSPELMTRLQQVGEFLRFESKVPAHLRELVVLLVARSWNQEFEWGHHVPLARASGLGEPVIDAVRGRQAPSGPDDVVAVWQFVVELLDSHDVEDTTYRRARDLLGESGIVEVTATAGYYTTLAMTMTMAHTPVPDEYEPISGPRGDS